MNQNEIDEIFEAFRNMDVAKILKYADLLEENIEITEETIEEILENHTEEEILKIIISKIEKGDYEYFLQKKNDKEARETFIELLLKSNDSKAIQQCIAERKEIGLDSYDSCRLLTNIYDIDSLIEKKELREKLNIDSFELVEIIKSSNKDTIMKLLEDNDKIQELGLSPYNIEELIKFTGDENYVKSILEDGTKTKKLGLASYNIVSLIKFLEDSEYIKSIIDDDNKMKEIGVYDSYVILELIKATNDSKYIEKILESPQKLKDFGLDDNDSKIALLKATKDAQYIDNILQNDRLGYELNSDNIIELILASNDSEYILNTIKDKKKMEDLGLGQMDIVFLKVGASNYAKDIIKQKLLNEDIEIDNNIVDLMVLTNNIDYVTDILNSQEKIEKLHITYDDKMQIIIGLTELSSEPKKFDKLRKIADKVFAEKLNESNGNQYGNKSNTINLPSNMTIGIEIESLGKMSDQIGYLSDIIGKGWECKGDGSVYEEDINQEIEHGIEVVSPILTGDAEVSSEKIKEMCKRLKLMRTIYNRQLWRSYTHRSRLFNYRKKLDKFS